MSRFVDINNEKFWDILFDEACVEGKQAERIENELNKICVSEQEIRVKAIDEFVGRIANKDNIVKFDIDEVMSNGNFDYNCNCLRKYVNEIAEEMENH